ncbi:hypothetical protein [Pseudothauera lacus]|nr:hypothetical protein [Pseudothauera lacus]
MFEKILIANRGNQPPAGGAAAQSNCSVAAGHEGGFSAEGTHV